MSRLDRPQSAAQKRDFHPGDRIFGTVLMLPAYSLLILLVAMALFLLHGAWPSIQKFGWEFVVSSTWDPVREVFGALPVIYGTIVSSSIAVLIAAPVSIGAALFLTELAPRRVSGFVGHLIEMLAAIPSVVYGLWGIFVLAPWLRGTVEPVLARFFGFLPLFQGPPYGVGMLAAGLILAIMIMPTMASISREVFHSVPRVQREAALALGATRWEMIRLAVLSGTKSGVFGAVILGLGRALGETMAVTMVIGNRSHISASLFAPAQTMASAIANEYAEATSDIHLSALVGVGLTLFVVTFVINSIARIFVWRTSLKWSAK
ncbi:MAG TPA: phosphate ABC transporter permease subunit PstC [Bdellovibrionota bacterium]|nr:phosphate ABC transporter permease subunit PstC [Bdellovibrionota bacterium]